MTTEKKFSNWVGCMYHLEEQHFDYLEKTLQEYDIGGYIIGHETDPYPHFHLAFEELSENQYINLNKKIVNNFKLRADSKKGKRKQYGKINQIKDIEKLKSYTVKDGNYRSNLSSSQMAEIIERSFKKTKKKEWLDTCLEYIEEYPKLFKETHVEHIHSFVEYLDIDERLGKQLILFHLEKEVRFTYNQIKSMVRYAIQKTKHLGNIKKSQMLWKIR